MDDVAVLHHAARQFCIDRSKDWREAYASLTGEGRGRTMLLDGSLGYSVEALNLFPRIHVADAILAEVEQFTPADFASLSNARQLLAAAADTAESELTRFADDVARVAAADERQRFAAYIGGVDPSTISLQPLPFRRSLGTVEHQRWHTALQSRWGRWYGGCATCRPPGAETATVHVSAMDVSDSYALLASGLVQAGNERIIELREYGHGYEVATDVVGFKYTGAEGFWTSADLSWLVYASHEASITFGGRWLIERMRAILPEFERYIYKGYELSRYG
jgi:hypothetical protein